MFGLYGHQTCINISKLWRNWCHTESSLSTTQYGFISRHYNRLFPGLMPVASLITVLIDWMWAECCTSCSASGFLRPVGNAAAQSAQERTALRNKRASLPLRPLCHFLRPNIKRTRTSSQTYELVLAASELFSYIQEHWHKSATCSAGIGSLALTEARDIVFEEELNGAWFLQSAVYSKTGRGIK
jgi:hypothetical protein